MLRRLDLLTSLVLLIIFSGQLTAQTQDTINQEAQPPKGVEHLAIHYFGIEFSKEQRSRLENKELELIFFIDALGQPELSEINGITDADLIDSLKQKTLKVGLFSPRIEQGVAVPSIFFMKIVYPRYRMLEYQDMGTRYFLTRLEDFESIEKSSHRFDMTGSMVANQWLGPPASHLHLGGGMKIDLSITGAKHFLYGLNMSFYSNKMKLPYSIQTPRTFLKAPPTILIGGTIGRWFGKNNVQLEFNYAAQNVTDKIGDPDPDWVQLEGWSPGLLFNFPIQLGQDKPMYYYGAPTLFANQLNLHIGFRYFHLSLQEASGIMMELGVGYRLTVHGVQEYRLKENRSPK